MSYLNQIKKGKEKRKRKKEKKKEKETYKESLKYILRNFSMYLSFKTCVFK